MKYKKIRTFFVLVISLIVSVDGIGGNIQISGFIKDKQSDEVLIGANVWDGNQKTGTSTDKNGYFSIRIQTPCKLGISFVGYQSLTKTIISPVDTFIVIRLEPQNNLNEVVVSGRNESRFNVTHLSAKELQSTPTLGGKPDVLKTLQLLSGVQSQSEGMSLMLVRGGDPGQNQYLLDNVPLIYVNHLGGFSSVFNPDMINSVDFYKGNFPAKQGGKLSSIVDITQREGDISKHQGSFSIGAIDASVTFEGPLANKKMSYIVTARKTLIDGFLAFMTYMAPESKAIDSYGFHDVNVKLSWKPDEKNALSLNLYQGDDYLNFWSVYDKNNPNMSNHIGQTWGNWLLSGHWKRVFSSKLYTENIVSYNYYHNSLEQQYKDKIDGIKQNDESLDRSSVGDLSLRSAWKYSLIRDWNIEFGGQTSFITYEPTYIYRSNSLKPIQSEQFTSIESALYIDNKISLLPELLFQPSFRLTDYTNEGINHFRIEPRINLTYNASSHHSFNLNYMSVSQNSHLVFSKATIIRKEIWLPATKNIPPQSSKQFSCGWNGSFLKAKFSTELNLYYKEMENLATLKEGYENMVEITGIENKMETGGKGIAYGTEFSIQKNSGVFTGNLSYSWSVATRQFAHVNGGKTYEYDYNHAHNLTLNINRQLKKGWTINLVWLYQTGLPYTPALGKEFRPDTDIQSGLLTELIYGTKNSARMQDYHRLDLGFSHNVFTRRGNRAVWTYSIYNVYSRNNPYNYYYDNNRNLNDGVNYSKPLKLYKISLFPFIPSISYKVYFDMNAKHANRL
jgi:hypothetical protein